MQRSLLLLAPLALLTACAPPVPPERDLLIATANPGGTYYPAGVAMATLLTRELGPTQNVLASPITSTGSAENIAMLMQDEVQIALVQGIFAAMARQGTGLYEGRPVTNLRGLMTLWPNVEQIVVFRRFATTGTVDDVGGMAGELISLGPRSSGTELSCRTVLTTLGFEPGRHFQAANLDYGPSADALQNQRLAGLFLPGGVPTGAISQAFASLGAAEVALLEFTDEHLARLRARYPVWNRFIIPAGVYPGQTKPVRTIAQPNFLATTTAADEEVIYLVVKTLWENIAYLHRQHAATRIMTPDRAIADMPLLLHAGAVRYYREAGLPVPDELVPPEMRD